MFFHKYLILCFVLWLSSSTSFGNSEKDKGSSPIKCPVLQRIKDGWKNCSNVNKFGSVCRFYCQPGYAVRGSRCRKCQSNGEWSGYETSCQPRRGCSFRTKKSGRRKIDPWFVERSCCPPGQDGKLYNPAAYSCCYTKNRWMITRFEDSSYECDCCHGRESQCWTCCDEEVNKIEDKAKLKTTEELDVQFKIVGGTPASFEAKRRNAYIVYKKDLWGNPPIPGFPPVCGGVLIHQSWVLTARHCISDSMCKEKELTSSPLLVIVGKSNSSILAENDGQSREVSVAICHEHYCKNKEKPDLNDIAIVRLSSPIDMTDPKVGLAQLPVQGQLVTPWTGCLLTGWGIEKRINFFPLPNYEKWVKEYIDATPATLQEVTVPVIPSQYCRGPIRQCHMCAGKLNKDGCSSDSGSPLFCDINDHDDVSKSKNFAKTKNRFIVHGIFNSGLCGTRSNVPGVYARVSFYRDWIDENMMKYQGAHMNNSVFA